MLSTTEIMIVSGKKHVKISFRDYEILFLTLWGDIIFFSAILLAYSSLPVFVLMVSLLWNQGMPITDLSGVSAYLLKTIRKSFYFQIFLFAEFLIIKNERQRSGSVVEGLSRDRRVVDSNLDSVTLLCP